MGLLLSAASRFCAFLMKSKPDISICGIDAISLRNMVASVNAPNWSRMPDLPK